MKMTIYYKIVDHKSGFWVIEFWTKPTNKVKGKFVSTEEDRLRTWVKLHFGHVNFDLVQVKT